MIVNMIVNMLTWLWLSAFFSPGMSYLETHFLVHRDLAARNVLLDRNLRAKVADFGLTQKVWDKQIDRRETLFISGWFGAWHRGESHGCSVECPRGNWEKGPSPSFMLKGLIVIVIIMVMIITIILGVQSQIGCLELWRNDVGGVELCW